jgi:hypothetical protein
MQLEQVRREVSSQGTMQVAKATIKATPKIFDMFANDTYANKPLAIFRELVANGIDAQRTVCPTRPVEVQLPCSLDPTCIVRDFGTGMAHDFVMGPFMAYTDGSTKDKSDDDIGGFGIGSKSPFAYVDQYTLRVVHEGILSVYTMFKDEDGIPAVGLQGQTTTDEPNGVEVSFPVEEADMETFTAAAQEALQYFRPLPLVTNGTLNAPDYTYVGTNWSIRPKAGPLGVIMGGVRYPVATSSLDWKLRSDAKLSPLLEYGLDLILPLGACGVAMSREQLSYIPKTTENIRIALESVIDDVVATFSHYFDNDASEWDAMKRLYEEVGTGSTATTGRGKLLMANAKYKGNKLETSFRIASDDAKALGIVWGNGVKAWTVDPQRSRRSSTCPTPKWTGLVELYGITPGEIETLIIDDLPQSPKSKTTARLREYITDQPQVKKTLVLRGEDETKVQFLLGLMRNPTDYVLTSSMPEPAAAAARVKNVRPRVRMFLFNGGNDAYTHRPINNLTPSRSKEKAVTEVPYADQPAKGIMVVMNSFDLPNGFHNKMAAELVSFGELVFVNQADESKLTATFQSFDDVFAERLKKALAAYPELPAQLALANDRRMMGLSDDFFNMRHDHRYDMLPAAARNRPFGKLFSAWKKYVQPLNTDQRRLAPFVKAKLPDGINPKALTEALEEKQRDVRILLNVLDLKDADHRDILFKHL